MTPTAEQLDWLRAGVQLAKDRMRLEAHDSDFSGHTWYSANWHLVDLELDRLAAVVGQANQQHTQQE